MNDRRSPRAQVVMNVVLTTLEDVGPCITRNLSLGGLFLVTKQRWPMGSIVSMKVQHDRESLDVVCRVTHVQKDGVGFSFVEPRRELSQALERIIEATFSAPEPNDGRRRDTRVRVKAAIVWEAGAQREKTYLRDISRLGAFVAAEKPPVVGSEIYVYLPGYTYSHGTREPSELRGCRAEVVRLADDGFGIRFVDPSAEFLMAINDLLNSEGE